MKKMITLFRILLLITLWRFFKFEKIRVNRASDHDCKNITTQITTGKTSLLLNNTFPFASFTQKSFEVKQTSSEENILLKNPLRKSPEILGIINNIHSKNI